MSQRSSLFSRTFPASLRAPVRASVIVLETVLAADEEDAELVSARYRRACGGLLAPDVAWLPAKRGIDRVHDPAVARGSRRLVRIAELHPDNVRGASLRHRDLRTRHRRRGAAWRRAAEVQEERDDAEQDEDDGENGQRAVERREGWHG